MESSLKSKNSLSNFGVNNIYRSNISSTNKNNAGYNIITGQSSLNNRNLNSNSTNNYDKNVKRDEDPIPKQKNLLSKLNSLSSSNKKNEIGRTDLKDYWKSSSAIGGGVPSQSSQSEVKANIKDRGWDKDVYENYSLFSNKDRAKAVKSQDNDQAQVLIKNNSRSNVYSREGERTKINISNPVTGVINKPNNSELTLKNNSYSANVSKPSFLSSSPYFKDEVSEFKEEKRITSGLETVLYAKQVGLDNLGNTCFMNTSLQCLLHCQPFIRRLFQEKERILSANSSTRFSVSKPFYELCNEIIKKKDSSKTSVAPYDFKRAFGQAHRQFSGYSQHDSQEFLRVLLEDISQELNRVINVPKYKELDTKSSDKNKLNTDFDRLFRAREDSIVIDTFYGQTLNIFTCADCAYETYSFEKFLDIPLLLENDSSVGFSTFDLLDEFFKNDKFKWDSPCENPKCKQKSYHTKTSKLSVLPDVLILSFQRYNGRLRRKNSSKIKFAETIDMAKYADKDCLGSKSSKYNLHAISNHTGSLDFGHYFAYVKLNDAWCEFNDSYVTKYFGFSTSSNTVYVLFYQREDL